MSLPFPLLCKDDGRAVVIVACTMTNEVMIDLKGAIEGYARGVYNSMVQRLLFKRKKLGWQQQRRMVTAENFGCDAFGVEILQWFRELSKRNKIQDTVTEECTCTIQMDVYILIASVSLLFSGLPCGSSSIAHRRNKTRQILLYELYNRSSHRLVFGSIATSECRFQVRFHM